MSWLEALLRLDPTERVFTAVAAGIAVLLLCNLLFAAATVLLRLRNEWKTRRWAQLEERWEPLILEVLTGERTTDELHAEVEARDRLFFVNFLLRYARRLEGEEADTIRELAQRYLPLLLPQLRLGDAERRARAYQTLAVLGLPRYDDTVLAGVQDESPLVAMVAARGLASTGRAAYVRPILENIHRFHHWRRSFLASMLASMGREAVPVLRGVLTDSEWSGEVRAVAAAALRELNDPRAGDLAADLLPVVEHRELAAACLRILAHLGEPRHLPVARSLVASSDPLLRNLAVEVLAEIGEPEDVPLLAEATADPSPWVALRAAQGLRHVGAEEELYRLAEGSGDRAALAQEALQR